MSDLYLVSVAAPVTQTIGSDLPTPSSNQTPVGVGFFQVNASDSNPAVPNTTYVTSAGNISEQMELDLDDIEDVILSEMVCMPFCCSVNKSLRC
jgi:hypothetical protein